MTEAIVGVLGTVPLVLGLGLATVGLYGMLRKPDIFEQLHAAGLVTGPAVILVLLAALASGRAEIVTSALLVVAFVLVTASLSTHAIALAAWRRRQAAAATEGRAAARRRGTADGAMRVLIAHDASSGADVAATLAAGLAWPAGSQLRLMVALEADLRSPEAPAQVGAPEQASQRRVESALAATERKLSRPGVTIERVAVRGDPARAIVAQAAAFDADLVIMGTRGLGVIRSLLEGSVASEVVDRAPCPVLVAQSTSLRDVVLAIDGSEPSAAAIEVVAGWPIFGQTPISVLTIATSRDGLPGSGDDPDPSELTGRESIAEAAVARLSHAGRDAQPHVRAGDAPSQIVAFAADRGADLIVLGSRGHTGFTRTLLGSVGRTVLSSAATSVLIVRSRDLGGQTEHDGD